MSSKILFLSHFGPDKAVAIDLKRRLMASPDAQAAGLKVWLDIDDLDEGKPWQPQLEAAIDAASAFAVIVGTNGIRNWVRAETDLALSRAIKDESFRIIPILQDGGSDSLTPFVKRYHAVRDPLNNPDALQRLLRAALGLDMDGMPVLTKDPFPGLRSMSEDWADRFFGRRKETDEVLALLRRHRAVTIVADSGAGKSSLAMAGVGHAWRGGALREDRPSADDPAIWHVVTMRPAENPIEQLRNAVEKAAKQLGCDQTAIASYREKLTTDPAFALRCGLDPASTHTLLILDQAEELVTLTPRDRRPEFGRLISALADAMGDRLRILITLRSDHLNLVTGIEGIGPMVRLSDAQFNLKQPIDLAEIVRGPLTLAGRRDEKEQDTLIGLLRKELSDRPGHLALAQMTLSLAWRDQKIHGGLLGAYAANGGARAALGNEAERIEGVLSPDDTARLMPIFIRLIRLSEVDTGATRRIAAREEFDDDQNRLIDRLAGEDYGRLVQTSAAHVEIAHEALITQWPRLHEYLIEHAGALRTLSDLIRRAQDWTAAGESAKHLTSLADEERFQALRQAQGAWLGPVERRFLDWSKVEHQRIRGEREKIARRIRSGVFALAALLVALIGVGWFAYDRDQSAQAQTAIAAQSRVDALALLALSQAETDPMDALKLVLGAWPKDEAGPFPRRHIIERAIRRSLESAPSTVRTLYLNEFFSGNIHAFDVNPRQNNAVIAAPEGVSLLIEHTGERTELPTSQLGPSQILSLATGGSSDSFLFLGGEHGGIEIRAWTDPEGRNPQIIRSTEAVTRILPSRTSDLTYFSTPAAVWLLDQSGVPRLLGQVTSENVSQYNVSSLTELSDLSFLLVGTRRGELFLADTTNTQSELTQIRDFQSPIASIDYHGATRQLAIGFSNGRVELHRVLEGHDLEIPLHLELESIIQLPLNIWADNSVDFIQFNHDGTRVFTGDSYGVLRVVDIRFGAVIYRIAGVAGSPADQFDYNTSLTNSPRISGLHVSEFGLNQSTVRMNIWVATSDVDEDLSSVSFWQLSLPQGDLMQIACKVVHSQPMSNGDRGLQTIGLAAEIGIDDLTLPEDCDTYTPPLPPEFRQ